MSQKNPKTEDTTTANYTLTYTIIYYAKMIFTAIKYFYIQLFHDLKDIPYTCSNIVKSNFVAGIIATKEHHINEAKFRFWIVSLKCPNSIANLYHIANIKYLSGNPLEAHKLLIKILSIDHNAKHRSKLQNLMNKIEMIYPTSRFM